MSTTTMTECTLGKQPAISKEKNREKEYALYSTIERLVPAVFKRIKKADKVVAANDDFYSGFVYEM